MSRAKTHRKDDSFRAGNKAHSLPPGERRVGATRSNRPRRPINRNRNMKPINTVKIYAVTCVQGVMLEEQGTGFSLRPLECSMARGNAVYPLGNSPPCPLGQPRGQGSNSAPTITHHAFTITSNRALPRRGYVVHRISGPFTGHCSAWFDSIGRLWDAEQYCSPGTNRTRPVKRNGPIWRHIESAGRIYRQPSPVN